MKRSAVAFLLALAACVALLGWSDPDEQGPSRRDAFRRRASAAAGSAGASGSGGSGGSAGAAWTPASESGLQLWLRGDLGISGSPVSTWADQSGHGNDATASGSNRPVTGAGINGQATVVFSSGTGLALPTNISGLTGACTMAVVFKNTTNPGASSFQALIGSASGGTAASLVYLANFSGYQPYTWALDYTASGNSVGLATSLNTSKHRLVITYDGTGLTAGAYAAYLDGSSQTVVSSGAYSSPSSAFSAVATDNRTTFTDSLIGEIAEVDVWDHVLGSTPLMNLETYLAGRY